MVSQARGSHKVSNGGGGDVVGPAVVVIWVSAGGDKGREERWEVEEEGILKVYM